MISPLPDGEISLNSKFILFRLLPTYTTNYGEGVYKMEGGNVKFYPYKKGGDVLGMLLGPKKLWVFFTR